MNTNLKVAAAIASVLSAGAAHAVDFYVTGASAQRSFWIAEMKNDLCGGVAPVEYRAYDPSKATSTAQPDFRAYTCTTASVVATRFPGLSNGLPVTMHYSAELGSIWGVIPFVKSVDATSTLPTTHVFLDPNPATCTQDGSTLLGVPKGTYLGCTLASSYNPNTDAAVGPFLNQHTPDAGLTDVELPLFVGVNWPLATVTVAQPQPTKATLTTLSASYAKLNGQVFAPIVNSTWAATAGPGGGALTTLSFGALSSIMNGKYKYWFEVPGVTDSAAAGVGTTSATGTPIILCRRDRGSGTQVTAQLFFEGGSASANCAPIFNSFATTAVKNRLNTVVENNSTDDITAACITTPGAIGIRSVGSSTGTTLLAINGVAASAKNAANGSYGWWYETQGIDNSAQNADPNVGIIVANLLAQAKVATTLPAEAAGAQNPQFALPDVGGNTPSVANANVTSGAAPTGLASKNGKSCTIYPLGGNALQ